MLHAVIMAGGSGTRFWPKSRAAVPKQLLSLVTDRALIVETAARLEGLVPPSRIRVITNAAYADAVRRLLPEVPAGNVVAEPCGRDTAPCIGLAAELLRREDQDAVMAVLAADHVVDPPDGFRRTLSRAAALLAQEPDLLVTFGVPPTRPATGYGYLEQGARGGEVDGAGWYRVGAFREKPDEATAREFVTAGTFRWNSGIFVFRADQILRRIARDLPELAAKLPAVADELLRDGAISEATFSALPKISIDYGIMEKDDRVAMIDTAFSWDDVGSFAALERVLPGDAAGNRVVGDACLVDARDNVVLSEGGHLVGVLGVEGLVVVHTPDATLVCRKEDAERVKAMVEAVKASGRSDRL